MKPLRLLVILAALSTPSTADIPSPACHNPMPRTPPIGKSPFVTNTWSFLELLSGTQQFLQMSSTLRDSTRSLYAILVKIEQAQQQQQSYIPYFPFSQALELYTHIVERKLHCWPVPKYLAFYLVQLRDLNTMGQIESYEPREMRVPNPVRQTQWQYRENGGKLVRGGTTPGTQASNTQRVGMGTQPGPGTPNTPTQFLPELPNTQTSRRIPGGVGTDRGTVGTARGTARTSDRDVGPGPRDQPGPMQMEILAGEGGTAGPNISTNKKTNNNQMQRNTMNMNEMPPQHRQHWDRPTNGDVSAPKLGYPAYDFMNKGTGFGDYGESMFITKPNSHTSGLRSKDTPSGWDEIRMPTMFMPKGALDRATDQPAPSNHVFPDRGQFGGFINMDPIPRLDPIVEEQARPKFENPVGPSPMNMFQPPDEKANIRLSPFPYRHDPQWKPAVSRTFFLGEPDNRSPLQDFAANFEKAKGAQQGFTTPHAIPGNKLDWLESSTWPKQEAPAQNNRENPIVIGDSVEEEKEATPVGNQMGDIEIEYQEGDNFKRRLFKRGDDDPPGTTAVKPQKLPTIYANQLRSFQARIDDFWSPIFDLLVSDNYLGFSLEQIRPTWQTALPWREYGDTLGKISTILSAWQKDRDVKKEVLTIEQLEAKFGHMLHAMTLGRLVTPFPRRPDDEVYMGEDDEELTVEEPSYG
ncbi:hypothetical protein TWF730_000321 [Orbilia blumenaviensis]|uniref:Secreted protein n=1 Tax=Orbilia blumenaviensis TaxID=1796055 RepID=A0AAV9VNG9_9PEZI